MTISDWKINPFYSHNNFIFSICNLLVKQQKYEVYYLEHLTGKIYKMKIWITTFVQKFLYQKLEISLQTPIYDGMIFHIKSHTRFYTHHSIPSFGGTTYNVKVIVLLFLKHHLIFFIFCFNYFLQQRMNLALFGRIWMCTKIAINLLRKVGRCLLLTVCPGKSLIAVEKIFEVD